MKCLKYIMLLLKYFSFLQTADSNQHMSNPPYTGNRTFWVGRASPESQKAKYITQIGNACTSIIFLCCTYASP